MAEKKNKNEKKSLAQQLVRFGFVGIAATLIDYGIMVLLTELFGVNYLILQYDLFLCFCSIQLHHEYYLGVQCNGRAEKGTGYDRFSGVERDWFGNQSVDHVDRCR